MNNSRFLEPSYQKWLGIYAVTLALVGSTSRGQDLMAENVSDKIPPSRMGTFELVAFPRTESQTVRVKLGSAADKINLPRTALWSRLLEIRNRALREGVTLLSSDEISEEISRRRGETE